MVSRTAEALLKHALTPPPPGIPPEALGQQPQRPRGAKLPRNKGLFASVRLEWLTDRRYDELFPARVRLFLYLLIKSRRGTNPVQLTNAMASKIGISRQIKSRCLWWLSGHGLVKIENIGHSSVTVIVIPPVSPI
jgi:hypothetical protein